MNEISIFNLPDNAHFHIRRGFNEKRNAYICTIPTNVTINFWVKIFSWFFKSCLKKDFEKILSSIVVIRQHYESFDSFLRLGIPLPGKILFSTDQIDFTKLNLTTREDDLAGLYKVQQYEIPVSNSTAIIEEDPLCFLIDAFSEIGGFKVPIYIKENPFKLLLQGEFSISIIMDAERLLKDADFMKEKPQSKKQFNDEDIISLKKEFEDDPDINVILKKLIELNKTNQSGKMTVQTRDCFKKWFTKKGILSMRPAVIIILTYFDKWKDSDIALLAGGTKQYVGKVRKKMPNFQSLK